MEIQALGYMGVGASNVDEWSDFATRWLGMQAVERGNTGRAFRMDGALVHMADGGRDDPSP